MKRLLISAELNGIPQSKILLKCRTYHASSNPNGFTCDDIREILNDWKLRGLVQRFEIREGYAKKPTRIWRATNDIKGAEL